MKKILFVLAFAMLIFTGCGESEKERPTIKVVGYTTDMSGNLKWETMYEWYEDDPDTMFRTTYTDTYINASEEIYNKQVYECDLYKMDSSLQDCSVEKKDGNVIVKKILTTDVGMTVEEAKDKLIQNGYTLKES